MTTNTGGPAFGEWQPIETAPRDGRQIILGWSGEPGGGCEGFWLCDPKQNHWGETGWFATDDNVLTEHPSNPDCWMPLPPPPKDAAIAAARKEGE